MGMAAGRDYVMTGRRAEPQLGVLPPADGREGELGTLRIGVPGLHNARNAAMATVAALQAGRPVRGGPGGAGPIRRGDQAFRIPR